MSSPVIDNFSRNGVWDNPKSLFAPLAVCTTDLYLKSVVVPLFCSFCSSRGFLCLIPEPCYISFYLRIGDFIIVCSKWYPVGNGMNSLVNKALCTAKLSYFVCTKYLS